ncbi:MAG TPA: phosphopantetheine-binding protein, partial [Thermoanaerobaculia bacterium]|nr:phosphopantetheine-binding protein [Thermoanaerobaculia bacterium]
GRLLALEREAGPDRLLILREAGESGGAAAALAATRARFGPVRGVFWTGGAFAGGLLQLKSAEALRAGLEALERRARDLLTAVAQAMAAVAANTGEGPEFVLLSATTLAVTGSLGEIEAAAGSSLLAALAAEAAADGLPALAVLWDPYQWGGWLVAGAAGGFSQEDVAASLLAHGIDGERSGKALERLLARPLGSAEILVSATSLPGLLAETDSVTSDALFAQPAAGQPKAGRPELKVPYQPPRDELEGQLAAIWQDLFGIEPIGRDDGFLDLGGHSLLAIQIVTQVRSALGADLPVTALFESPTVAELARAIRQARGEIEPQELEALLALVEGLSPEEAALRLAELGG